MAGGDGRKRTRTIRIDDNNRDVTKDGRSFEEGQNSSNAADVAAAEKMMNKLHLGIDDEEVTSQYRGPPIPPFPPTKHAKVGPSASGSTPQGTDPKFFIDRACDLMVAMSVSTEPNKSKLHELANRAMDELAKIAVMGKPLWNPRKGHKFETMDDIEYVKIFGKHEETIKEINRLIKIGRPQHLPSFNSLRAQSAPTIPRPIQIEYSNVESSRDVRCVKMQPLNIIQLLMNVNQWSKTFYNMVSKGIFLGGISYGEEGSYDGRLQVMTAEYHLPTAFIAARECYFARYCKKLSDDMWGIVDFSLETIYPCPDKFQRRPSGCLFKEMPNGYSEVIWVEHALDNNTYKIQFQSAISSGLAFAASRWLDSLVRSIECCETLKPTPIVHDEGTTMITHAGQTCLLNVADRMMRSFCDKINISSKNQWIHVGSLLSFEEMKIKVIDIIKDFGRPKSTKFIFTTTVRLPISPKPLFDFLCDPNSRKKWEMLSSEYNSILELINIVHSNDVTNHVSIIQLKDDPDGFDMFYLQKSYMDTIGSSYIVYSPIEKSAISSIVNGGNPLDVIIEPSGLTIIPDEILLRGDDNNDSEGSILTIALSIMICTTNILPLMIPSEAVTKFKKISAYTINGIKDALLNSNV